MLFEGEGVVGLLLLALWVYAIFDVIATEEMLVRNLPRMAWLFLVILIPDVGAIAWLALGRPYHAGWRPGDTQVRPRRRPVGLEDRADWAPPSTPSRPLPPASRSLPSAAGPADAGAPGDGDVTESLAVRERRLMEWEAELRRREASLGDQVPPDRIDE